MRKCLQFFNVFPCASLNNYKTVLVFKLNISASEDRRGVIRILSGGEIMDYGTPPSLDSSLKKNFLLIIFPLLSSLHFLFILKNRFGRGAPFPPNGRRPWRIWSSKLRENGLVLTGQVHGSYKLILAVSKTKVKFAFKTLRKMKIIYIFSSGQTTEVRTSPPPLDLCGSYFIRPFFFFDEFFFA